MKTLKTLKTEWKTIIRQNGWFICSLKNIGKQHNSVIFEWILVESEILKKNGSREYLLLVKRKTSRCKFEIKQRGSFFLALLEKGSNTWERRIMKRSLVGKSTWEPQRKTKIIVFNLCTWNIRRKKEEKRGRKKERKN